MAVNLSPLFQDAQLDANGNQWSLAKLFTYIAGSTTKQTTYQDSAGATPHSNPIILNSRGEPPAPIWLTAGVTYKFVLTSPTDSDPPVASTRTVDSVKGVNDTTVTLDEWVSGPAPTYVSATSFTLVGDQTSTFTVGRRVKVTDSGGTKYGTIKTAPFTTLTTITLDSQDSDALATPTSAVSYGLLNPTNTSEPVKSDALAIVGGSSDRSKRVRIEADGITTATTRVITMPDADVSLSRLVQVLNTNTTAVGNVGGGTDDLMSYTLPANSLSADGKGVRITAWGTTANNANAKSLGTNFGVHSVSTDLTISAAKTWRVTRTYIRTGASSHDISIFIEEFVGLTLAASLTAGVITSNGGNSNAADIIINHTAAATSNNDIVQEGMLVEFLG